MNRDKLDNELRHKLGESRVAPPSDMWDRIAATLKEQGLTAERPAAAEPAPAFNIRRPRKLRLGYAAAAAILVCAVVFGLRLMGPGGDELAQNQPVQEQFHVVSPEQIDALIAQAAGETGDSQEDGQTLQDKITASVRTMVVGEDASRRGTVLAHAADAGSVAGSESGQAAGSEREINGGHTVAGNAADGQAGGEVSQAGGRTDVAEPVKADDNRGKSRLPQGAVNLDAQERYIPELKRNAKKAKGAEPFSLGLYSADLGQSASEKVIKGNSPAKASDFTVKEAANEMFASVARADELDAKLKHKMPISAGISVAKGITGRLSIESGVTYSYLHSKGENTSGSAGTYSIKRELHYVGIPVGVKYDILQGRVVDLYAGASGLFEMCVSSKDTKQMKNNGITSKSDSYRLNVRGIQPSMAVRVGAEVKLARNIGVYVEPGINYYFENGNQPESYRTENPLNFSLRAGVRLSLK